MSDGRRFRARFSEQALRDFEGITAWTLSRFGEDALLRYEDLILQAIHDLEEDPFRVGSKAPQGLPDGVRTYHLTYSRGRARSSLAIVKNPRHLLLHRFEGRLVQVLRLLHDEQDLGRHISELD